MAKNETQENLIKKIETGIRDVAKTLSEEQRDILLGINDSNEKLFDIVKEKIFPAVKEWFVELLDEDSKKKFLQMKPDEQVFEFMIFLEKKDKQSKTPTQFLVWAVESTPDEIKDLAKNGGLEKKISTTFDPKEVKETSDIKSVKSDDLPKNVFEIVRRCLYDTDPIVIPVTKSTVPNLRRTLIVGDVDCSGYKPKKQEKIDRVLNALPYAVTGKLNCDSWGKEFFKKVEKFPYAKSISFVWSPIDSLDDLIGKLPVGLKEITLNDKFLVKDKDGKEDNGKTAEIFLKKLKETHPDLVLISNKKNTPPLSLKIIADKKAEADRLAAEQAAKEEAERKAAEEARLARAAAQNPTAEPVTPDATATTASKKYRFKVNYFTDKLSQDKDIQNDIVATRPCSPTFVDVPHRFAMRTHVRYTVHTPI